MIEEVRFDHLYCYNVIVFSFLYEILSIKDCVWVAVSIGSYVHIGRNSVIGQSCVIKDCCYIMPDSVVTPDTIIPP